MTYQKSLNRRDISLYIISAILLIDTITPAASNGVSSIAWWLVLAVVYFLPYALISAELASCYPTQGGIYIWVRKAFGKRWGSRVSWMYWLNVACWSAALFIFFAAVFKQLFFPTMSLTSQIVMGLVLTWLCVWINIISLNVGKWVPNLGALCKIAVFLAVIIGGISYGQNHQLANDFSFRQVFSLSFNNLQYVAAMIYGLLGFELISSCSDEVHNPKRNLPRAILVSGVLIILFYILATIGVLTALPAGEINLVEGLIDVLFLFFGESFWGKIMVYTLGCAAMYTFFSTAVTWSIGGNRTICESAIDKEFPPLLAKQHKQRKTPVGAAITLGAVCSLSLLFYGVVAESNEDLFWNLFAFSAIIFFANYLLMPLALLKLRRQNGQQSDGFEIPFGPVFAKVCVFLCFTITALAMFFFIYIPESGWQWSVIIGSVIALALGEVVIRVAEKL